MKHTTSIRFALVCLVTLLGTSPALAQNGSASPESSADKVNALKPGQGAWANYDFVPGNRPLFVDDFSRDRVGNFPKRLELKSGMFEIVEWESRRFVRAGAEGAFSIILPEPLPERWTMEFDATIPWWGMAIYPGEAETDLPDADSRQQIQLGVTSIVANGKGVKTEWDPRSQFGEHAFHKCIELCSKEDIERAAATWDDGEKTDLVRVRIHADGSYMKVYFNEQRVANMPNMGRWQGKQINIAYHSFNKDQPLISGFSINAGGRDMYDALMADGRLAVQGIYFDVGSDRIRAESSGTLKEIADVLGEHPDLKLTIEGHTDNVGDAAANQKLSERRAAAVVAALAGAPYSVARDRLNSVGLGATKPAKPNDTPEARQANRRVELVVQK